MRITSRTHRSRVRRPAAVALIAMAVVLGGAARTSAVPLPLGDTALGGTTSALRPELAGLVLEDVMVPYSFVGSSGELLIGEVQNRVVRSDDGTVDFYWRIVSSDLSTGRLTAFRVIGFDGYALDGDFRVDGVGTIGPAIARNLGAGAVNFLFDGISPGVSSRFFFLDTQATAYAATGNYDLLCAPSGCISPLYDTFAPANAVPEPATASMVIMGVTGLLAGRFRRRESPRRRQPSRG